MTPSPADDEPPPILGSWGRLYTLVLLVLVLVICAFYGWTRFFA